MVLNDILIIGLWSDRTVSYLIPLNHGFSASSTGRKKTWSPYFMVLHVPTSHSATGVLGLLLPCADVVGHWTPAKHWYTSQGVGKHSLECGRPKLGFLDSWTPSCRWRTSQRSWKQQVRGPQTCDEEPQVRGSQTTGHPGTAGSQGVGNGVRGRDLRTTRGPGWENGELWLGSSVKSLA